MEYITQNAQETKKLGKKIAHSLMIKGKGSKVKDPKVLALTGELGSGKTTFIQGLAEGLGITQRIISPTFILMRKYDLNVKGKRSNIKCFYHIDLYRLEENIEKQLQILGVDEVWSDPGNFVAIEWAEKAKEVVPGYATWIRFENLGGNKRKIVVND